MPLRLLITAGPTHEPIDDVRYIANRSSGRMGAAVASAAVAMGLPTTVILGPVGVDLAPAVRRIDVVTAAQMHAAVLREFPNHDLLIMAAAVADFSPVPVAGKLKRRESGAMTLELFPTADIVKDVVSHKRDDQRTVAFSLEKGGDLERAAQKMRYKKVDLMVYNSIATIDSPRIVPTLLWPDGRTLVLDDSSKGDFAGVLLEHATRLFDG